MVAPRPRIVIAGEALIDLLISQSGEVVPAAGGGQYNAWAATCSTWAA